MNRANPAELRKAIEAAQAFVKAGILFVPMPVIDQDDLVALQVQLLARLDKIAEGAEEVQP